MCFGSADIQEITPPRSAFEPYDKKEARRIEAARKARKAEAQKIEAAKKARQLDAAMKAMYGKKARKAKVPVQYQRQYRYA
jgi:hypothetical protein